MAWKRYSDEDVLKLLCEIDVHLHDGLDVVTACRKAGISDKSYYYWRKKFGGLSRSQVSEMKSLKKENERLTRIVADLQLDKLILKESLRLRPTHPTIFGRSTLCTISLAMGAAIKCSRF